MQSLKPYIFECQLCVMTIKYLKTSKKVNQKILKDNPAILTKKLNHVKECPSAKMDVDLVWVKSKEAPSGQYEAILKCRCKYYWWFRMWDRIYQDPLFEKLQTRSTYIR